MQLRFLKLHKIIWRDGLKQIVNVTTPIKSGIQNAFYVATKPPLNTWRNFVTDQTKKRGRGRPKIPPQVRKVEKVFFRATEVDRAGAEQSARKMGESLSTFCLKAIQARTRWAVNLKK